MQVIYSLRGLIKKMFKLFVLNCADKMLKKKVKAYIIKNVTHPYGCLACMNTVH